MIYTSSEFKTKLSGKQSKLLNILHHQKNLFFSCVYIKLCQISKEAYEKCEIETMIETMMMINTFG